MHRFSFRVRPALLGISAALILCAAGCGYDVKVGELTGGSGGGGSNGGTGGGTTSATTAGSGGAGTGGGSQCSPGVTCAADEYCDYPNDRCGSGDGAGVCAKRPSACDKNLYPTCACDGKIYGNACEAATAGVDASDLGGCKAPLGEFGCGAHFCTVNTKYCLIKNTDAPGLPGSYACTPVPSSCGGSPTCLCLAGMPCQTCVQTSDGGFELKCLGG